jgi:curli biogenesis system outer membrane secretion channel CsgG
MLVLLITSMLLQGAAPAPQAAMPAAAPAAQTAAAQKPAPAAASDRDLEKQLISVKRIYVDSFGDDTVSKQIQAMVVSGLTENKRFIVTENKERADAFLRGAGLETTSQEFHSYGESTAGGSAGGYHQSSGSVAGNASGISGSHSSSGGFHSLAAAISDSGSSTETIDHARVAVRLVNPDGDVLWATTQESKGAKYKGASADVADKVVKELLRTLDRLAKKAEASTAPATPTTQPAK